ncbi:MAG TPA: cytochrome c [Candidatus Acidoferrales bacterium]|jgi:mono/diheme cytochrome c family protein|nr:cytochrome c [Candidatus Acidoferrales bacterium]
MRGLLMAGTLVAFAALLSACSNSASSAANADADAAASPAASSAPAATAAVAQNGASANDGAGVYSTNCSSCHQTNGAGLPGAFPPLATNAVVTGDPKALIHIVKFGLNGKITVGSQAYNGTMPAWGQNLSDGQIASVVTFIRSSWGNHAGAVTTADVTSAK